MGEVRVYVCIHTLVYRMGKFVGNIRFFVIFVVYIYIRAVVFIVSMFVLDIVGVGGGEVVCSRNKLDICANINFTIW